VSEFVRRQEGDVYHVGHFARAAALLSRHERGLRGRTRSDYRRLMGRCLVLASAALLLATTMPRAATPFLTGVVEGYYGRPWTGEARRDVIRFLGAHGMNTFVYGPKNDLFHRDRWRDPYPEAELADLTLTAREARTANVRFVYALSPALGICYACPDDTRAVRRKLRQLVRAKVKRFALFFDDAPTTLSHPEDIERYGGTGSDALARAQAELIRRTNAWLRRHGLPGLIFMVPTDYFGTACSPYLAALDATLPATLPVGWTGTAVIPATITTEEATLRRGCVGDRPLVLWDNYPVNDTMLSSNLHLGPFTGRAPNLGTALGGGHLLNPMTQAHASLVALGTAAAYFADPSTYDPEAAWRATLTELAPAGSLDVLAEQTRSSALDLEDAHALAAIIDDIESTYASPTWTIAVDALASEIERQRAASDAIETMLGDTPLGLEIAPWVDELRSHLAEADVVRDLLRVMKPSVTGLQLVTVGGARRVVGSAVLPNAAAASTLGPIVAAERPAPNLNALLDCLGPLLSADIDFCPQLGLNVHGKRLYVSLANPITLVTGRNRHDQLLDAAALAWSEWTTRQPTTPTLTVTIDGLPVSLGPDGSFDAPVAATGTIRVLVSTDAGDATTTDLS
jgi:hyaluronoglucosaminidase